MLTHGSHLVDLARFLGGEIEAVQARLLQRFDSYCWFVAAAFADGSLGHLDLIVPIRGDFEKGFQVFGKYGNTRGRAYLPWYFKSSDVEVLLHRKYVSIIDRWAKMVSRTDAGTGELWRYHSRRRTPTRCRCG